MVALGARRGRAPVVGIVVMLAAVLGGAPPASLPASAATAGPAVASACPVAERSFTPRFLRIPGVVGRTKVLALGRDRHGVPRTPPLTDRGKWQLGWDRQSRIRPGSKAGVVRLTAHTYPRDGSYGLALGNRLLAELRRNARIVVTGPDGRRMCYRVTGVRRVRATESVLDYYTSAGPPRLAILVCSGRRRGPGNWSHRTIWFAKPVTDEPA